MDTATTDPNTGDAPKLGRRNFLRTTAGITCFSVVGSTGAATVSYVFDDATGSTEDQMRKDFPEVESSHIAEVAKKHRHASAVRTALLVGFGTWLGLNLNK